MGLVIMIMRACYIPIVPTLSEESAIPMITDEDAVDHITKTHAPCSRGHFCTFDTAGRT